MRNLWLDEARLTVQQTDERMFETEICRLTGEVHFAQDAGTLGQAKTCFEQAINIARNQGIKPLELRATVSLARLLNGQGESGAAYSMLESIYGSFTEGFDTPDLRDARALLDELS